MPITTIHHEEINPRSTNSPKGDFEQPTNMSIVIHIFRQASSPTSYQHVNYTHMHIDRVALCRLAYLYHTVKVASSYRSQLNYLYSTLDLFPIIIMLPAQTPTYLIHHSQPKTHTNDKKQSQEAICSTSHTKIMNEYRGVEEFCVKKNLQELWKE